MSAEVDWFFDDPSQNKRGEHIGEGELAWTTGYGDGSGRETCVMVSEGFTKIVIASVESYEDEEGNKLLNVRGTVEVDELPVGEPRMQRVQNLDGNVGLLTVRNLGVCPDNPDMRPAWN